MNEKDLRTKRISGAYTINNEIYLSVTTILSVIDKSSALTRWFGGEVYDFIASELAKGNQLPDRKESLSAPYQTNKKAKNRGTTVHSIVEGWKNMGSIAGIEGPFQGYARSFRDWVSHHNVEIVENEKTVISKKYGYAGTLDMLAKVNGKLMIVDVKTGKDLYPEVKLQTSAYRQALLEGGINVEGTSALLLQEDGSYKFETHPDKLGAFLAAKILYTGLNSERLEKLGYKFI